MMKTTLMILSCATLVACGPAATKERMQADADAAAAAQQAPEAPAERIIPGLQPVDVHLSLKNQGFTVQPMYGEGITWTCIQKYPSVEFRADVYGPEVEKLSEVNASVMADGVNKTAEAGTDFLAYVCSLPYDGSNPAAAQQWLRQNYNNNGATITIGAVRFTLQAPTVAFRMLRVEPAN